MNDVIAALLDKNNTDPIFLYNEDDDLVEFEQIAVIQCEGRLYCILKPVEHMEGVADNEALVFHIDQDEDSDDILTMVVNDGIIDAVFDSYHKLVGKST